eukprot:SAG11_NODE_30261_length_302_cov_1.280788_1_plen_89_part_01
MLQLLLFAVSGLQKLSPSTFPRAGDADNPLGITVDDEGGSYRLTWMGKAALSSAPVGLNTAAGWCAAGDCLKLESKTTADGEDVLGAFH